MAMGSKRNFGVVFSVGAMLLLALEPNIAFASEVSTHNVLDMSYLGILSTNFSDIAEDLKFFESLVTSKEFNGLNLDSVRERMLGANDDISVQCRNDTLFLTESNGTTGELLQYIDAAGKLPKGVTLGNWQWVGNSRLCHDITAITNPYNKTQFQGKYYSVSIVKANLKPVLGAFPLVIGVCVPDSCTEKDVQNFANNILYPTFKLYAYGVLSDDVPKVDRNAIGVMTYFGILVALVIIGTLVDVISSSLQSAGGVAAQHEDVRTSSADTTGLLSGDLFCESVQVGRYHSIKQRGIEIMQAFSFLSNSKKLFSTSTANGPLACLNGLRVLSMSWVILGHTYAFLIYFIDNPTQAMSLEKRFSFQPILNGTFSVDSFFFLSGLLVAYLALKELYEKGHLNWVYFFLHRFWRLTPLYLFVLLFYAYLYIYTVSGPMSFMMVGFKNQTDICKKYMWTNLLYVNNFYPDYGNLQTTCLGWGWYLANDMQFYIFLSPVVILSLFKRKRLGLIITISLIMIEVINRGIWTDYYGVHGITNGAATKHTNDPIAINGPLYARPWARYSVYLIGMLTGYVLAVKKNRIHLSRLVTLIGWSVAIATGMSVIYGLYYYSKTGTVMTTVQSVFYMSLCRTAWGLCLSWLVLACVAGKGGPVNQILSWTIWAPLGRLTYAAYLVHPIIIFWSYMSRTNPVHFDDVTMIYVYVGHLFLSYSIAFIVSMLSEAPMMQLEKIIVKLIRAVFAGSSIIQ